MGACVYRTQQGDMWDYIAWKVYGDEMYVSVLYKANPQYLTVYIFDDGCEILCPEADTGTDMEDVPEWRDTEDAEDAMYDDSEEDADGY